MTHKTSRLPLLLLAIGSLWVRPLLSAEDPKDAPPIPKGFESEDTLKTAILTGQVNSLMRRM